MSGVRWLTARLCELPKNVRRYCASTDPSATVADGIAVVRPAIGDAVLDVVRRDGGGMVAVSDEALLSAVGMLASRAGVGAEPAGAAALAGLEADDVA